MRTTALMLAIAALALAAAGPRTASADPYKWCAVYGGNGDDAGTNCYFMTVEQCRAAVSGVGGFCTPNQFYDGRPIVTPEEAGTARRPKRAR